MAEQPPVRSRGVAGRTPQGPDRTPPVQVGERVAHYEILGEIGRGGMGVVFRARDSVLERDVALKCPWPALARDPTARQRFVHEAHAAARLAHPNIVPVFEVLECGGIPWLVMELVEGRPLRALLNERGALPLDLILRCAEGIADALRAAHAKKILHRDLNPNNVLLTPEAWPFLTDFGLARVFASPGTGDSESTASGPLSSAGHVVGTRCYMSPEQVLGKPLDVRSDIFSFGAVLYEMCTGRRAFPSTEPGAENDAILHYDPSAIRSINAEIPEDLDRIARKALSKRPEERYQGASDLHADIVVVRRQVESGARAAPRPAAGRGSLPRWAYPAGILTLGAALAVWQAPLLRSPSHAFPIGTPRQITSDPGWESDPALSPDGSQIAYASDASGNPDIWILDVKGSHALRLTEDPATDRSPAWFPDGSALAFVSDRGGEDAVWKVPRLGGSAVLLVPDATDPAISPDGTRIAFARPNAGGALRIVVAPLAEPSRATAVTGNDDGHWDHTQPAWSPDGRTICYADDRDLWIVDASGGRPRRLTNERAVDSEPSWSSDGRFVIFSSYREGTRALWRVPSDGGVAERLTLGAGPETQASISRDGSRLAYSTYLDNFDIAVMDVTTGRRELIQSLLLESAPTFAPDGSAVVFASTRRGGHYDLWLQPLSLGRPSGPPRLLTDLPGSVNTPAFSPDGRWVAFKREHEGRREIWIIRAAGGLPEIASDGSGIDLQPAWAPDGSALAYASERNGQSHLWIAPIQDGRRVGRPRRITSGTTVDDLPAWSPDGRDIAYRAGHAHLEEVWTVAIDAAHPPRRLVGGAQAVGRLRWDNSTGWLWLSRLVGGRLSVWKVPPQGGEPVLAVRPEWLTRISPPGEFDLSRDGRLMAFTIEEVRGDLWLLETERAAY